MTDERAIRSNDAADFRVRYPLQTNEVTNYRMNDSPTAPRRNPGISIAKGCPDGVGTQ